MTLTLEPHSPDESDDRLAFLEYLARVDQGGQTWNSQLAAILHVPEDQLASTAENKGCLNMMVGSEAGCPTSENECQFGFISFCKLP